MTDVSKFRRDLTDVLAARVAVVEKHWTERAITIAFTQLATPGRWPADTFYSMANHKVSVGEAVIEAPKPSERPEGGNLSGLVESNRARQLNKMKQFKGKGHSFFIGNPVPYAADVGFQTGQGRALYANAARYASAVVAEEIKTKSEVIV